VVDCPPKGSYGIHWKGKTSAPSMEPYSGGPSAFVKVQISNNIETEMNAGEYLGFMTYSRNSCGKDFLNRLEDGRVKWGILDWASLRSGTKNSAYFKSMFLSKREDGKLSSVTMQFYRFGDTGQLKENANGRKTNTDQALLALEGVDKVQWGKFKVRDCLEGVQIGTRLIDSKADIVKDHTICVGRDKDFWN